MTLLKRQKILVCFIAGVITFAATYPFYHDIYIATLHTVFCVLLNAFSSILFSALLYYVLEKRVNAGVRAVFIPLTVIQAIGHFLFAVMNWGSFFFLALSAIVSVALAVSYFKDKKKDA